MAELFVKYEGKIDQCPICSESVSSSPVVTKDAIWIICPRCGEYQITHQAQVNVKSTRFTPRERANMSSWLYENQHHVITTQNLAALITNKAPSFHKRADMLLLALEKKTEFAGQTIEKELYWFSASWCLNDAELNEITNYLALEQRIVPEGIGCKIAHRGWARLEELQKINADSEQCFVAMWFDDSLKPIYDNVIAKGILNAGYRPHKVDQREHNNKIDDEIIAQIRRSRFIVADFTGTSRRSLL